ncbi:uncharacterized protein [Physeter macrocephalus]|uniref:Uncharacterized protein n=1 Tax=Physeter macrocephalus TaxID=9755 RepID=A0A455AXU1_PHYMC|nr:uncharacterized protein LOC102992746 [Physeter catodon]|eukprot:XP_028341029.1 uncharacterized protein LOC102992746 [Physeter catodon]
MSFDNSLFTISALAPTILLSVASMDLPILDFTQKLCHTVFIFMSRSHPGGVLAFSPIVQKGKLRPKRVITPLGRGGAAIRSQAVWFPIQQRGRQDRQQDQGAEALCVWGEKMTSEEDAATQDAPSGSAATPGNSGIWKRLPSTSSSPEPPEFSTFRAC